MITKHSFRQEIVASNHGNGLIIFEPGQHLFHEWEEVLPRDAVVLKNHQAIMTVLKNPVDGRGYRSRQTYIGVGEIGPDPRIVCGLLHDSADSRVGF